MLILVFAVAMFMTMGLMRYTYRQAKRREEGGGIRWRGIQWQKPEEDEEALPAEDDERKGE